jgi:hypothetical protein
VLEEVISEIPWPNRPLQLLESYFAMRQGSFRNGNCKALHKDLLLPDVSMQEHG